MIEPIKGTDLQPGRRIGVRTFFSRRYKVPILLAFLFAFFNQVSGINAIIYFAPRVFNLTGMGNEAALLSRVGIGVVIILFTMLRLLLVDKYGRRKLIFIGSVGYLFFLSLLDWFFYTNNFSGLTASILISLLIRTHAISLGAVICLFISEIFPNSVRSYGISFGSATHWIFAAVITGNFVWFESLFGGGPIFAFFAVMMVLQLLFVWKMMPETKGVPLEEIEKKLGIPG